MTNVEEIFRAIQSLPANERRRLIERIVHELADVSAAQQPDAAGDIVSPIGLFADDPEGVDEMMKTVMENRRASRLRPIEDEDEKGSS